MAQRPDTTVLILDFKGTHSNAGPHAMDKGESQFQVNVGSVAEGRNDVRVGFRAVVFDN